MASFRSSREPAPLGNRPFLRRAAVAWVALALFASGCGTAPDPIPGDVGTERTTRPSPSPIAFPLPPGVLSVDLPDRPIGLAAAPDGRVWTVLPRPGLVVPLDRSQGALTAGPGVEVGGVPLRAAAAADSALWVTGFNSAEVTRVGPDGGVTATPVGDEPEGVAVAGGSVWVVDQAESVVRRLTPEPDGTVAETGLVPVGFRPRLVAAAGDGVVVSAFVAGTVTVVEPDLTARTSPEICSGPQGLGVTTGQVWVACSGSGEVVVLGLADLRELARIPDLELADGLTVAPDQSVLVATQRGPTVVRFDPVTYTETGRVVLGDRIAVLDGNVDVAATGDGWTYVSAPDAKRVYGVPPDLLR